MSAIRLKVPTALFVCMVETTRWPVMEAWTAMEAVSWSRISPIIMISGSWRRIERRADANVRATFGFTWIWLMPSISASTGSSTVTIFTASLFISLSAVYSVVDLPLPVGPVTNIIPKGCAIIWSKRCSSSSLSPSSFFSRVRFSLEEIRSTSFSPWTVGIEEIRISYSCLSTIIVIRPSWGFLFSEISIPPIILIRVEIAGSKLLS